MAAPRGNKNAKKDQSQDSAIYLKIDNLLKSHAQEHAEEIGLTLSEYIKRLLKDDLGM